MNHLTAWLSCAINIKQQLFEQNSEITSRRTDYNPVFIYMRRVVYKEIEGVQLSSQRYAWYIG